MTDESRHGTDDSEPKTDEEREEAPSAGRQLIELVITLALAFLLAMLVRTFVVEPFVIPTGSMIPTIMERDQVLVNKFIFRFRPPQAGDIVVLDDPTGQTPALIKRVIAVGGQTVDVHDGKVWVDGVALNEPYTHGQPSEPGPYVLPVKIPAGDVWVMGDNRTMSKDSRWIGPQPITGVRGDAFMKYWPPNRIGLF